MALSSTIIKALIVVVSSLRQLQHPDSLANIYGGEYDLLNEKSHHLRFLHDTVAADEPIQCFWLERIAIRSKCQNSSNRVQDDTIDNYHP